MNTSHGKGANPPKRKKQSTKKAANAQGAANKNNNAFSDGHMTAEEVERHLQSRQSLIGLVPEAPATVPNEMFSNEPSLDRWGILEYWQPSWMEMINFSICIICSESNDQMIETSPSNLGEDCISIDMNNVHE